MDPDHIKDLYPCPIEIINGLTDKGQFQYRASRGDLPVYHKIIFTIMININNLSENN